MTPTISKSVQKQIQKLLASNMTYEQAMERIPGLKKSTLGTVADKTGAQKLKSTLYLRHMSATFVAYTI